MEIQRVVHPKKHTKSNTMERLKELCSQMNPFATSWEWVNKFGGIIGCKCCGSYLRNTLMLQSS